MNQDIENKWLKIASDQLVGRKIVSVRYMCEEEVDDYGWHKRSLVIELDDGNCIFPSVDEEGNEAGVMFTQNPGNPVLPTLY
jgi:hypothetical protein